MSENGGADNEPVDYGEVVRRPGPSISWAWLFPVLAAAATAWLFWTNWKSNGPEVEVQFDTAPGIQAGKTPLIYRGVTAGTVTAVRLDHGLDKVVLTVRLKAFAAELAREGTVFWIDEPVVGLGKTSGLDALIQGNSLQARIGGGPLSTHFTGADRVPLTPLESPALILKLRAHNIPFLDRGSPLFYRGVAVGSVEDKAIDASGNPYLRVVVDREFAQTVRTNARFWPVPATSVKIGPGGVKLDMLGLKAILLGGVEFDVFGPPGGEAPDESEFTLFPDQASARATGAPVRISFKNGQGILAGQTQVRHLGMPVGYVETAELNAENRTVDTVVRFQPAFEHLHTAGTVFTLIRPRISIEGVSGLETLVTGPYIDCAPGPGGGIAQSFEGRTFSDEDLLTSQAEDEGIRLTLHAKALPPLREGAPVLYRGLVAGRVKAKEIDANNEPFLDVVIRKEFAKAVARNARFWQVPAASVQAGPGVLKVDVAGLETLVQGGAAFDVFGAPEAAAESGSKFELLPTESAARATSPPIHIAFDNGQGLLAGQTQVRTLGVPVGIVESVTPKNGKVEAVVRLNAGTDALRREGSAFSVVRLNVSINGVSGLETVVSGVYIDCVPAEGGRLIDHFTGVSLAKAAFEEKEERGFEVVVTAAQTNIGVDAPVSYRGLIVGKVGRKVLSAGGRRVGLCVVINPPYASLIRENTKFWDAGGLKVSLGFLAIKVQTASLDALARGGLAFATPDDLGPAVKRGHEFELNPAPRREWLRWAPALPAND
ncbi:MAG: MlaD family protein [Terrimicrobiaceae bacterium]|nr:MlaD family protein [Terrimicrobiaceae bacterium]